MVGIFPPEILQKMTPMMRKTPGRNKTLILCRAPLTAWDWFVLSVMSVVTLMKKHVTTMSRHVNDVVRMVPLEVRQCQWSQNVRSESKNPQTKNFFKTHKWKVPKNKKRHPAPSRLYPPPAAPFDFSWCNWGTEMRMNWKWPQRWEDPTNEIYYGKPTNEKNYVKIRPLSLLTK